MRVSFENGSIRHTLQAKNYRGIQVTRDKQTGEATMLAGYPIVFNSESESFGQDFTGRDIREVIAPDACDECLRGSPDIRCLADHDTGKVLGRTASGTLRLSKDDYGVKMECDLANTSIGRDLAVLIDRGDIDGMSFGFYPDMEMIDYIEESDKVLQVIRRISKINEVSIVAFPAYPATNVALRDMPFYPKMEKFFREAPKPLSNTTLSLISRLEIHKRRSKLWNI